MRVPGSLASDVRSLDALKTGAAKDPQGAVRQAASQFEALFMQMVLKSMRDAVPKSGMLEGPGADVYQGMLDTQFAQAMSGRPGGLSELIAKQLMRNMRADGAPAKADAADADAPTALAMPRVSPDGLARAVLAQQPLRGSGEDDDEPSLFPSGGQVAAAAAAAAAAARARAAGVRREAADVMPTLGAAGGAAGPGAEMPRAGRPQAHFVDRMWPAALAAQQRTGVPAAFIVGQSALESGWGRQEPRFADGRSSHNLFGIKAGPGWRGEVVEASTTEFVDGRAVKSVERFRAYGSYEESFADWARMMASSPRYAGVLRGAGSVESFAQGLQRAGYATDPDYASKLTRTITTALSLRRTDT
jgi:flagellar protein FlgJ